MSFCHYLLSVQLIIYTKYLLSQGSIDILSHFLLLFFGTSVSTSKLFLFHFDKYVYIIYKSQINFSSRSQFFNIINWKNLSSCHYFLVPPLTLIKLYILEKYLKFMRRDRSKNGHTVYWIYIIV